MIFLDFKKSSSVFQKPKYIGFVPPRHKPFPRSQLKSPVQSSGLPSSRILFIQWPFFNGNGINIFISLHSQSNKIPYTRQKVLNILPIILFSKIAQQRRTKEGRRKILLFFTIVVENNKLKQVCKLLPSTTNTMNCYHLPSCMSTSQ